MIPRPPAVRFYGVKFVNGEWIRGWINRAPLPGGIHRELPRQRDIAYSERLEKRFRWWDNDWLEERSSRGAQQSAVPVFLYAFVVLVIASMLR